MTRSGHITYESMLSRFARLTARQVEVLRLSAQGLSNAEIGERLFISPLTVKQHAWNLAGTLGVNTIREATYWYGVWSASHHGAARPAVDELPVADQLAFATRYLRDDRAEAA